MKVSIKSFQIQAIPGRANHFYCTLSARNLQNVRNNHNTYFAEANFPQSMHQIQMPSGPSEKLMVPYKLKYLNVIQLYFFSVNFLNTRATTNLINLRFYCLINESLALGDFWSKNDQLFKIVADLFWSN